MKLAARNNRQGVAYRQKPAGSFVGAEPASLVRSSAGFCVYDVQLCTANALPWSCTHHRRRRSHASPDQGQAIAKSVTQIDIRQGDRTVYYSHPPILILSVILSTSLTLSGRSVVSQQFDGCCWSSGDAFSEALSHQKHTPKVKNSS